MRNGSNTRRGLGRSVIAIAGVVVLGTFVAVIWFAYADVIGFGASGPPPLVQAEAGPIKRLPDDPGGMSVAERSPATGILEEQVEPFRRERILPRQEEPVVLPEPEPPQPRVETAPPLPLPDTVPAPEPAVVEALIAPEPQPEPPSAVPPAPIAPLAAREPAPTSSGAATPTDATPSPAAILVPNPAPRPVSQPASQAPRPEPQRSAATEPARSAPAASATFRIQLGAFRSENAASQAWTDLQRRNRPALAELRPNITTAETSSGTFFRLQAGSLRSRDAAVQTCAQLKAAGNDCFVVGPLP